MKSTAAELIAIFATAFFLNFVWEMWQVPFYLEMVNASHWQALVQCSLATVGDGVITAVAYMLAITLSGRDGRGGFKNSQRGLGVFITTGLTITVAMELLATNYLNRWQYSELMPIVPLINVGLVPILQWSILPPVILWLSRVFLRGLRLPAGHV